MIDENLQPELPMDGADPLAAVPTEDVSITKKKMEDGLRAISTSWLAKLKQAQKHKRPFTDDAIEAMNFFDGQSNWFWKDGVDYSRMAPPSFRMQVNRVFEAVKLFGSVIYHRNPVRNVTAKKFPIVDPQTLGISPQGPPDPMTGIPQTDPAMEQFMQISTQVGNAEQARRTIAESIQSYLNYTPNELNLKENSRRVVDEAIIKGMGVWWTELITLEKDEQGGQYGIVGSFYDSCDNLLLDPDADEQEDCLWSARRCVHPIKDVAAKYGIDEKDLKGHMESYAASLDNEHGFRDKKKKGKTNDLIVYYKIYSKTGFGHTLKGFPKEFQELFDGLGSNCYVVVAEGVDFPLNAPKEIALEQPDQTGLPNSLFTRTRWPIPFHMEAANGWPWTALQFHRKPGYVWPISHIKPGISELRFINWAMSFLATRVMTSCKTTVGVAKAAGEDIKDQLLKHEESGFNLVELSETLGRSVDDLVSVFQMPEVNPEIYKIVDAVSMQFDKATGLTELAYGMTRNQYRSAAEAQVKAEAISVRPDDMANCLEDAMSMVSRKEAMAARWLLQPEDVAPIIGPLGAELWGKSIMQMDVHTVAREFDYRVEAGSARKPNKASEVEKMQMAVQTLAPVLQGLIPMGMTGPINALLGDWAKSLDIDPEPYMIPPPPPPPPPMAPEPSASEATGEPAEGGEEAPPPPPEQADPSGNPVNVPPELIP